MPSIINRIARDSFFGRSQSQKGRGKATASVAPAADESDENLDLFSKNRQSLSLSSSDQSAGSEALRRLSFKSGKVMRSGLDDLIASADKEKHDYDWLLTPPGTPLDPSSERHDPKVTPAQAKRVVLARSQSVSTSNASSRLSVSQMESNPPSRLARSSSVTRSLSNASQFSAYSSTMSSSILNTSSASVSSHIRSSFSSARPITSPTDTPSRARLIPRCASTDRARPLRKLVSSAPSARIQIPATSNSDSSASRANSRASTPTRRISAMSPSSLSSSMSLMARPSPQRRTPAVSRSCPSSPGPKTRPSAPIDLNEVPPNLRVSLPIRAISTGRSRPGLPSLSASSENASAASHNPRSKQFSPIVRTGRPSESVTYMPVARKIPVTPESTTRKPVKSSTNSVSESSEFRRSISRKSMDASVRHTDNKVSTGRVQSVSGGILYPQSTRPSVTLRPQTARIIPPSVSGGNRIKLVGNKCITPENGHHYIHSDSASSSERDIFEDYRFDANLLNGDSKSTNWLCNFEESSDDGGLMFDHGLDLLPEPFGPL